MPFLQDHEAIAGVMFFEPANLLLYKLLLCCQGQEEAHMSDMRLSPANAPAIDWDAKISIKLLIESAPVAIVLVGNAGQVLYANAKFEEMFGFLRDEVLGQVVENLMPERFHLAHQEHRSHYVTHPHVRTMGSGMDLAGRRKDGSEFPIEAGLSYLNVGDDIFVLATITDISQRKRTEQALRQSEERYRRLVDLSPYAIFLNRENRIVYVNAACMQLFGAAKPEDLVGRSPFDLIHPDHHHVIRQRIHHMLTYVEHMSAQEEKIIRLDGKLVDVEVTATPYHDEEGIAIQVILADITDRKQAAELLERRVEERTREIERRRQVSDGLGYIVAMLNSNHPLEAILNRIVTQATQLLGANASAIYLIEDRERHLVAQASQGLDQDLSQITQPLNDENVAGFVTLHGQNVVFSDLTQMNSDARLANQHQVLMAKGYRALLGVSLLSKNETIGSFVLYYTAPRKFRKEEIDLAQTFSNQAALAIENERLRAQIERTAVAAERSRIARDLHDAVTQTLFSASMIAEVLPRLWQRNAAEGERRLAELRELTRGALAEMRTLLLELRPARLIEVDMADLLRQLAEAIAGRARVPVSVQIEGEVEIPADVKVAFYRIAQEALNNVAKHAQARHAQIQLYGADNAVNMKVFDDGCGFVFERIKPEHLGLGIMRERAEAIGATLEVQSRPDHGTVVSVRWMKAHPSYLAHALER
jgi:PAS domain S-box-containing protein